jgi:hypothetical protein
MSFPTDFISNVSGFRRRADQRIPEWQDAQICGETGGEDWTGFSETSVSDPSDGRFRGQSGIHLLTSRLTDFDPDRISDLIYSKPMGAPRAA